jgi:hypothetical protein
MIFYALHNINQQKRGLTWHCKIGIAARRDFKSRGLWEVHTLRAKVFRDRLGWEVPILSGVEIDGYDALEPQYHDDPRD